MYAIKIIQKGPTSCCSGALSRPLNTVLCKKEVEMKKLLLLSILLLCFVNISWANSIEIKAIEFGPEIIRKDFELAYTSTMKGDGSYKPKVLYISKFHIIYVEIINGSDKVINVNANYFTLVTNKKRSCSYSSETHGFKKRIQFIKTLPFSSVDVYPGTITDGFLLFDKKYEKEKPKTLYFRNPQQHLSTDVILDKKTK